jgi:hypothetical protein
MQNTPISRAASFPLICLIRSDIGGNCSDIPFDAFAIPDTSRFLRDVPSSTHRVGHTLRRRRLDTHQGIFLSPIVETSHYCMGP